MLFEAVRLQEARYVTESVICDPYSEGLVLSYIEASEQLRSVLLDGPAVGFALGLRQMKLDSEDKNPP